MTDKQRMYAYLGGGALLLFLLYQHFAASSAGSSGGTVAPNASTADTSAQYAGLAGQEQGDIAGLQAQEQSDVQNLMSAMGQNAATEQSDYQTVTGQEQTNLSTIQGLITGLAGSVLGLGQSVANITAHNNTPAAAQGSQQTSRGANGATTGGTFSSTVIRLSQLPKGMKLSKGEMLAPFGHNKPKAPNGYTTVGIGSGNWIYRQLPSFKSSTPVRVK